jgi:hypothetical protein
MKVYNLLAIAGLFFGNIQPSNIKPANNPYPCLGFFRCGTFQDKEFIDCVWRIEQQKLEKRYSKVTGQQIIPEFKKSALEYVKLCNSALQETTSLLINKL